MRFFEDIQTFVTIGPISIKWYGLLILLGAFIAYYLSLRNLKKMGYDTSMSDDLFIGALLSGVVGSRIWFVVFYDLGYYLRNPIEIFMTWEGGLAIQGGLVFGAAFGYWFVKRHNISFMRLADAIVPNILIAQALGRWGNFLNQEAFGRIVDESFYAGWPRFIADHMYINGAFREPTFFYESTLNIVGFLLIVLVYKRISNYKRGDLMYAYLMWYGVTRFFIEGFRSDSLMFFGLRSAQLVSIAFLIAGMLGTLGVFRKIFKREKPIMLFDFDGTLMDTEQTVKDGIKQVILKHQPDLEINPDMENSFVGPPLSETFSRFFEASQIDDLIVEFRVINNEMHKTRVKPIEHAIEVIKELKEQGYLVGVVSSKISSSIHMGMDLFDMRELFDVIIGVDDVKEHKPSPEGIFTACKRLNKGHDAVIYIGDTAIDIQAGHAAGVYTVAMMTNPSRKDELEAEKPNAFITDLRDLFDILKEDVEWTRSTT